MEVYDISRKALRDLESRGIFRDDGAHGRGDYLVVICLARFAKSPRRIRILERYEDERSAKRRACACQDVAEGNAQWSDLHYVNCYEVWHVVGDYSRPKHEPERVKYTRIPFDDGDREIKVERLCVLSVGFVSTPEIWEAHIEHCYAFVADGIRFLYSKISHPLSGGHAFYEFVWTVADDADFTALAGFMSKMAKLGCVVEFGPRNLEVVR